MQVLLNGELHELAPLTSVGALLEDLGLDLRRVAVELNRRILKRAELDQVRVREGDEIEVVTFVGGG
jgi:thiamine biosynthesis protein ThiS